ncbi:MAG TPA: TonB family protein [Candidatus Acidoferrales bacterium]|nr:TonB family protein [Candidatus Acidoferrales bacterium]
MMSVIYAVMLAVSSSLAASIVAKVTVTLALGLIGAWLARRSRAAVRHALLAAAFGVLLVLPIASIVAPPVRIAVPAAPPERTAPALAGATRGATLAIPPVAPEHPGVGVTPVVPRPAGLLPSALLLTAWIAGAALFLLPVVMGLRQVRWLRRSALPWRHGQSVVDRLALDAGIHRRVEVLRHGALPGPMTCGVVHPAIVLSEDAQTWQAEDLNRAIVHELEHVRRGDWVSHCLARAVCAVYWFHPLVWIVWRQLALEAERSCDDAVLGRSEATAYADQLVGLARRLSLSAKSPAAKSPAAKLPILAMANHADLAARVGAVLDSRQRRGRAGTFWVALACAAAAVIVLTLSPLTTVAAPQSAGTDVRPAPIGRLAVNTMLVSTAVTASDRNGLSIEGLNANDFAVTEDGVAQTISIFENQEVTNISSTQSSISSYYIVGYYTANHKADRKYRTIKITSKKVTIAKLDYRAGYYTRSSDVTALGGIGNGGVDRSIGLDITPPVLLHKIDPEYSEEARKAKYQGTAVLNVEIDASGEVANIKVNRSLGLGLDEKAMEAVRQWKFKPGMKNGQPVTVQTQVEANFRLL